MSFFHPHLSRSHPDLHTLFDHLHHLRSTKSTFPARFEIIQLEKIHRSTFQQIFLLSKIFLLYFYEACNVNL